MTPCEQGYSDYMSKSAAAGLSPAARKVYSLFRRYMLETHGAAIDARLAERLGATDPGKHGATYGGTPLSYDNLMSHAGVYNGAGVS